MRCCQILSLGCQYRFYEMVRRESFPIILGGDHSITYPAVLGFAKAATRANRSLRIGYLHIDHHFDYGDTTPLFGPDYHGTTAKRVHDLPEIEPRAMAFLGTGTRTSWQRWTTLQAAGIKTFSTADVEAEGIRAVTNRALDEISAHCDTIYVTIDIDVVDSCCAPGTGSIVWGGLTPIQMLTCMAEIARYPVGAIDLVEVAPEFDPSQRTAALAASLLTEFLLRKPWK